MRPPGNTGNICCAGRGSCPPGPGERRSGMEQGKKILSKRNGRRAMLAVLAAAFFSLAAAPGAFASSNIEVVAGSTLTNNSGAPSFTPTGDDSQVGADLISAQLQGGTDVTLDTTSAHAGAGAITVNAAIAAAPSSCPPVPAACTSIAPSANITSASLRLDSDLGNVLQGAGSITVTGNTHAETDVNHDITLQGATNDFGVVSAGGATLSIRDQNALVLGSFNSNGNIFITTGGNVAQSGGSVLDLVGGATFDVGSTHDLTMTNAGNDVDFTR